MTQGAKHSILKISPTGDFAVIAGADVKGELGSADGIGNAVRFNNPTGIAVDSNGIIYVADTGNNTIRKGVPTVAAVTAK